MSLCGKCLLAVSGCGPARLVRISIHRYIKTRRSVLIMLNSRFMAAELQAHSVPFLRLSDLIAGICESIVWKMPQRSYEPPIGTLGNSSQRSCSSPELCTASQMQCFVNEMLLMAGLAFPAGVRCAGLGGIVVQLRNQPQYRSSLGARRGVLHRISHER